MRWRAAILLAHEVLEGVEKGEKLGVEPLRVDVDDGRHPDLEGGVLGAGQRFVWLPKLEELEVEGLFAPGHAAGLATNSILFFRLFKINDICCVVFL